MGTDPSSKELDPYRVARLWAQWHLGSPTWADNLLFAYNNPEMPEHRSEI